MRQFHHGILHLLESTVKPLLQLLHRDVRSVAIVEIFKRQTKLGAELIEGNLSNASLGEDKIRSVKNRGKIIHKRA